MVSKAAEGTETLRSLICDSAPEWQGCTLGKCRCRRWHHRKGVPASWDAGSAAGWWKQRLWGCCVGWLQGKMRLAQLLVAQGEDSFLASLGELLGRAKPGLWMSQRAPLKGPGPQRRQLWAVGYARFLLHMHCFGEWRHVFPVAFYYICIFHYKIKYLLKKGLWTEERPLNRDVESHKGSWL